MIDKSYSQYENLTDLIYEALVRNGVADFKQTLYKDDSYPSNIENGPFSVIGARASSEQQGGDGKNTLPWQIEDGRAISDRLDLPVGYELQSLHKGWDLWAPHLVRITEIILEHENCDTIIFTEPRRAFRSASVAEAYCDLWTRRLDCKVQVGFIPVDLSDPYQWSMLQNQFFMAETELRILRERAMAKHRYAKDGRFYGKHIPLGYSFREETRELTIDEDQAPLIKQLYQDVTDFQAWGALHQPAAKSLGIESEAELAAVIRSPYPRGRNPFGDEEYRVEGNRIVADDLWLKANATIRTSNGLRREALPSRIQPLVEEANTTGILRLLCEKGLLSCPNESCTRPLKIQSLRQVKGRGPAKFPVVGCGEHNNVTVVSKAEYDDLQSRNSCWNCGEIRISHFGPKNGGGVYRIVCGTCGQFEVRMPSFPWGKHQSYYAPANRTLDEYDSAN